MGVIHVTRAIRRSAPEERWVDIEFDVSEQDRCQIVGYEAYVIPANGRIRKQAFSPPTTLPQRLTVKYLRMDMSYKFKVHAIFSDDTVSTEAETSIVLGTQSEQGEDAAYMIVGRAAEDGQDEEVNSTPPEFSRDIWIVTKNINDGEDIAISWDCPKIEDTSGYQITGFHVKVSSLGKTETVVKSVKLNSEDTTCTVRTECGQTYKIQITMMYWDVDSDCMKEVAAQPKHYTANTVSEPNSPNRSKTEDDTSDSKEKKATAIQKLIDTEVHITMKISKKIKDEQKKWVYYGKLSSGELHLERDVAIKILGASEYEERQLLFGKKEKEKMERRMVREAQHLLDLIQHPNVVQYIHSCENGNGRVYIAMEICHEKTLEDRVSNAKYYTELRSPQYCKLVLLHVTQGLHYIHSKNIYHRDLKTSNILFSLDERVVKISDFGYSKKVNPDTGEPSETERTSTDGNRPPETYKDKTQQSINDLSDVFCLGIVYFVLLSGGKHPFGDHAVNRSFNIKTEKSKILEGLTGPSAILAKDLIENMLEFKQDLRPKTSKILKHPYFWSLDKVVNFYIRVVDQLSNRCISHENDDDGSLADNFQTKLDRPNTTIRKIASHEYLSLTVENQVESYFLIARNAAAARESEESNGPDGFFGRLKKDAERRLMPDLISSPCFCSLDKQAQNYIRVIRSIPEALEDLKQSRIQNANSDSSSGEYSEDETKAGSRGSTSASSASQADNWSSDEVDSSYTENAQQHFANFSQANDHFNNALPDTDHENGDHIKNMARKAVERVLEDSEKCGRTKAETLVLLENASAMSAAFLPYIDDTDSSSSSSSISIGFSSQDDVSENTNLPSPGLDRCEAATCSNLKVIDQPLKSEILPDSYVKALKKWKKEVRKAVKNNRIKETLFNAQSLIKEHDQFLLRNSMTEDSQPDKEPAFDVNRLEQALQKQDESHCAELIKRLNNLKLMRRKNCTRKWMKFKTLVTEFESATAGGEGYLKDIRTQVEDLVEEERDGVHKTWKDCLRDELTGHASSCPCIKFVNNVFGAPDNVFDLIKYIRNKLVHFEETKRSHGGNWMKQQEDILNFVAAAVPELLPHMFDVMKEELADFIEENKEPESSFFLPLITRPSQ